MRVVLRLLFAALVLVGLTGAAGRDCGGGGHTVGDTRPNVPEENLTQVVILQVKIVGTRKTPVEIRWRVGESPDNVTSQSGGTWQKRIQHNFKNGRLSLYAYQAGDGKLSCTILHSDGRTPLYGPQDRDSAGSVRCYLNRPSRDT